MHITGLPASPPLIPYQPPRWPEQGGFRRDHPTSWEGEAKRVEDAISIPDPTALLPTHSPSQHLEMSFQKTDLAVSLHWFRRFGESPLSLPTLAELLLPCLSLRPARPWVGGGVFGFSLHSAGLSAPYHLPSPFPDCLMEKVLHVSLIFFIAVCCAFAHGLFLPPWFRSRCFSQHPQQGLM